MRMLVLIKQVPLTSDVTIDEKTGVIQRESAATQMNPYDLFAVELALQIRNRYGGEVLVLTMGPPQSEAVVREAYAMGADGGYLLTDRALGGSDVLATSYALSQAITVIGDIGLIICGKQTTDGDTGQVGPECSEFLNIPCATAVRRIIDIDGTAITVQSDAGRWIQTLRMSLPALISVDKDINQPRLPSYVQAKNTAKRPVKRLTISDLSDTDRRHYGLEGSPTQVLKMFAPQLSRSSVLWQDGDIAARLYDYLRIEKFLQEAR